MSAGGYMDAAAVPVPDGGDDALLTVAEVHERLSVGISTVYHWIASGQLPAVRDGVRWGGTLGVRESDLDAFIQQRKGNRSDGSDAGDDTLREQLRMALEDELGGPVGDHIIDALRPLIREHVAAEVQAERERIERALPEAIATRVTWGDGMEFIAVADAARIVREEPDDGTR